MGFLLCVLTMYTLLRALFAASSLYGLRLNRHERRLARVVVGTASALLALQSVGELGTRDALVLLPLTILTYLYVSYGQKTQQS